MDQLAQVKRYCFYKHPELIRNPTLRRAQEDNIRRSQTASGTSLATGGTCFTMEIEADDMDCELTLDEQSTLVCPKCTTFDEDMGITTEGDGVVGHYVMA